MKRTALAAAPIVVLAAISVGCTSPGPRNPASTAGAPVAQPAPYWAGTGVVQAVTPAPRAIAAGPNTSAKSPASDTGLQRLRIRMDDGRTLYVDTSSRDFQPGTRVQLTDANEIRRL